MRIATLADKALVEGIVNHPEVLPLVSCDDAPPFDATPYLKDPHIALIVDGGCFFGFWHGYGRVECHTAFLPAARGRKALREGRKAIDYMFTQTNCFELVTKVPQDNPAADWYAKAMGFRVLFERRDAWVKNGVTHPIRYYALDMDDWIIQGHFRRETGEAVNDCYAGAAEEMIAHGQGEKSKFFYDRWSQFSGCVPWYRNVVPTQDRTHAVEVN